MPPNWAKFTTAAVPAPQAPVRKPNAAAPQAPVRKPNATSPQRHIPLPPAAAKATPAAKPATPKRPKVNVYGRHKRAPAQPLAAAPLKVFPIKVKRDKAALKNIVRQLTKDPEVIKRIIQQLVQDPQALKHIVKELKRGQPAPPLRKAKKRGGKQLVALQANVQANAAEQLRASVASGALSLSSVTPADVAELDALRIEGLMTREVEDAMLQGLRTRPVHAVALLLRTIMRAREAESEAKDTAPAPLTLNGH